jgi:hypothetical protein
LSKTQQKFLKVCWKLATFLTVQQNANKKAIWTKYVVLIPCPYGRSLYNSKPHLTQFFTKVSFLLNFGDALLNADIIFLIGPSS